MRKVCEAPDTQPMTMDADKLEKILYGEMPREGPSGYKDLNKEGVFHKHIDWGGLGEVPSTFYEDCRSYVASLEAAILENPLHRERVIVEDELRNARMLVDGIRNRRLAKITDLAAIVADGAHDDRDRHLSTNESRMTPEERICYYSLIDVLKTARLAMGDNVND